MKKTNFSNSMVFIKGMFMGIADIVPGVSGGTIAIITGIYEELLKTLDGIDIKIFSDFKKHGIKDVWENYNLSFLFRVVSGIFLSIMIFSQFILLIIRNHPIALWSLFFGLILASILFLLKETDRLNFKNSKFIIPAQLYLLLLGIFVAIYVQTIKPNESDVNFEGESKVTVIYDDEEVEFSLSKNGDTILDVAMDNDLDVPFSCKGAVCCTCRAKVKLGKVVMDANYSLSDQEVEDGYILTCQAHPVSEKVIVDFD